MINKDTTVRIFLLEKYELIRAGVRLLIDNRPGFEVIGEAGELETGIKMISALKPDIVLLDLNLEEQDNSNVIDRFIKASEQSRVLLITENYNSSVIQQAVENGISGVVLKSQSPDVLMKAIDKVYAGEVWLERSMIAAVLSRLSRNGKEPKKALEADKIDELSSREKEIIGLIGLGYKNKRISEQLFISETTVRHHLTSIYSKLGVSDRLELLVYAHRFGLVKSTKN